MLQDPPHSPPPPNAPPVAHPRRHLLLPRSSAARRRPSWPRGSLRRLHISPLHRPHHPSQPPDVPYTTRRSRGGVRLLPCRTNRDPVRGVRIRGRPPPHLHSVLPLLVLPRGETRAVEDGVAAAAERVCREVGMVNRTGSAAHVRGRDVRISQK